VPANPIIDSGLAPWASAQPDFGEDVSGGVESLCLGRAGGERGGVLGRSGQLDSDRIVGLLADDAGADEHSGQRDRK